MGKTPSFSGSGGYIGGHVVAGGKRFKGTLYASPKAAKQQIKKMKEQAPKFFSSPKIVRIKL
jgi:hypothetical protein